MVKTTDTKASARPAQKQQGQPFFNKESGNAFFDSNTAEKAPPQNFFVQRKLKIGQPDDIYEKEADSVADKVVQKMSENGNGQKTPDRSTQTPIPVTPLTTAPAPPSTPKTELQQKEEPEKKEEEEAVQRKPIFDSMADPPEENIQRKPIFDSMAAPQEEPLQRNAENNSHAGQSANSSLQQQLQQRKGSGSALPAGTRQSMESAIGADFSGVRIHNDSTAVQMSKDLNAQAFTHGSDIYFNAGKYDPSAKDGQRLLAHELTHTIQQGKAPAVQKKFLDTSLSVQKEDDPPVKSDSDIIKEKGALAGVGYIKDNGGTFQMMLTDFPLKRYKGSSAPMPTPPVTKPKPGTRNTKQGQIWRENARDDVKGALNTLAGSPDDKLPFSLTLKSAAQTKGETQIVGDIGTLAKEVVVPFWAKTGTPVIHQIEHVIDWQVWGDKADTITNLLLLDQATNLAQGKAVEESIKQRIDKIRAHYAGVKSPIVTGSADTVMGGFDVIFETFTQQDISVKSTIFQPDLKDAGNENPIRKDNIELKQADIPKDHCVIKTARSGAGYIVPYNFKNDAMEIKGDAVNNKLLSVTVIKIAKDPTNSLTGANERIDLTFVAESKKDYFKITDSGYAGMLKDRLKLKYLSPLDIAGEIEVNPVTGFQFSAKVLPTIPLLDKAKADIDFTLEALNFAVTGTISTTALEGKLPAPFKINYSSISVSVSTQEAFKVIGEIGFGIDKVGTGRVTASAGVASGFALSGEFLFENSKLFRKAMIGFEYAKGEWTIKGELSVAKGKIKGIDSADLKITYGGGQLTADGTAKLSIPGIDTVTLKGVFGASGDFTITGEAVLKKMPGISSGKVNATLENKGSDYELSMTGTATPDLAKVPGLGATFTISYAKGLFKAEADATYKKGRLDGSLKVGVTNAQVDKDGKPSDTAAGDALFIYGNGGLKIDVAKGVEVKLSAAVDNTGSVVIWGDVNINAKPFDKIGFEKTIFNIANEIPLVGVPFLSLSLILGADAKFYFNWEPLTLEINTTLERTSLEQIEKGDLGGKLDAHLHSDAKAGVEMTVRAGLGVTVAVLTASANVTGSVGLEVGADMGAKVGASWDTHKGLKFEKGEAYLKVAPSVIFKLAGDIRVELNLLVSRTELYRRKLGELSKALDLSQYGFNVDVPLEFDDNGKPKGIDYGKIKVNPPFSKASGEEVLDKSLNGDDKASTPGKEDAAKTVIRKEIAANMRSKRSNASVDMYTYATDLRAHIQKSASPDLQMFVVQAIEEELKIIESEDFDTFKNEILASPDPLKVKQDKIDLFEKQHLTVDRELIKILRDELQLQEESKTQSGNNSSSSAPVQSKRMDSSTGIAADPDVLQSQLHANAGKGAPLPEDTKAEMGEAMDTDLSGVRVHTDNEAGEMSRELNAQAFTHGKDIYFNEGKFDPASKEGKHLLAHELTHTVQQGAVQQKEEDTVQKSGADKPSPAAAKKAAAGAPPAAASGEMVKIGAGGFNPSDALKETIRAAKNKWTDVNISAGEVAGAGVMKVREKNGVFESKGNTFLPLNMQLLQQANPMLAVKLKDGKVSGFGTIGTSTSPDSIPKWLRNNGKALGWLTGIDVNKVLKAGTNKFEDGIFSFAINGAKVKVGGFADATMDLGFDNLKPNAHITANIDAKGIAQGSFEITMKDNLLSGEGTFAVTYKSFAGNVDAKFMNGVLDVKGSVSYTADKLSGSITLILTDKATADNFARNQLKTAPTPAEVSLPEEVPAAKEGAGPRALAGMGTLTFNLTEWFAGSVNVMVDGKGNVTVVGKIAPPKEIRLFEQKDYNKELFKLEARASYGLPVIGNVFVFANLALAAIAKVGPAKIYNIEVEGTYSTDPEITKSITLAGSLNISAYAGLRLRAEGGVGIEILDHDLKVGVGLNADAGVKGYVDARPVIGYRDPGEFFFKGHMEIGAQPFLGLSGDLFAELDTPWWSPLSDDKWTWPIGALEYPLPGEFGIGADMEYVLGSNKIPEITFSEAKFDGEKFMTDLIDDNVPKKTGGDKGDKQGKFIDKGTPPPGAEAPGSATGGEQGKDAKPPVAAPAGGKGKDKKGKDKGEEKPTDMKKFGEAMKQLQTLEGHKPMTRAEIDAAVAAIRSKYDVPAISITPQGTEFWIVRGTLKGKPNKQSVKVKAIMKPGEEKDDKHPEKEKQNKLDAGINDLKTEDRKVAGDGKMKKPEAEKAAQQVQQTHSDVFRSISVIDGGNNWKYHYVQRSEGDVTGSKIEEENERINRMDNGLLDPDQRKALLAEVIAIVGEPVINNIFTSTKSGKSLIKLFDRIKEEDKGKGLKGGFRIVTRPMKDGLIFIYFGFAGAGDSVSLGEQKMRAENNKAYVENETLYVDFIVSRRIGEAGVKGAGSKMFEMARELLKEKFEDILAEWLVREDMYKDDYYGRSDNLTAFIDAMAGGATKEDAAKETWTYKRVKENYDVAAVSFSEGGEKEFKFLKESRSHRMRWAGSGKSDEVPAFPGNIVKVNALLTPKVKKPKV